jgi:thioesterase-3
MINHLELEVRSTEIDAMAHVNNAKYLEYLEWGRFGWVEQSGLGLDFYGRSGLGTVIANINIDYRAEATLGDRLRVATRLASLGTSSLRIRQTIYKDATVVADAVVTAVMFDTTSRASVAIPDELRPRLEALVVRE